MEKLTKVEAVIKLLNKKGGSATWKEIYDGIEKYYPEAKASNFWKEGLRGVVNREIDYDRTFIRTGKVVIALR